jgi:hypothetical protein
MYQSFGYNPLKVEDIRLAYKAPDFSNEHWFQLCSMEVARQSKVSAFDSTILMQKHSRAWYACSSFAVATRSRNYHHGMRRCFDMPSSLLTADESELNEFLDTYGILHARYISQCRLSRSDVVVADDPWHLRNLSKNVFHVLRDRWDVVQSVYELAIYESNRDIQRSDEYIESLQWNTCHPHVQALHLVVESEISKVYYNRLSSTRQHDFFHDPCKKLRMVPLLKRMHYRDALLYANLNLAGSVVVITNADILIADGFDGPATKDVLFGKNAAEKRLLALSRHERPQTVIKCAAKRTLLGLSFCIAGLSRSRLVLP